MRLSLLFALLATGACSTPPPDSHVGVADAPVPAPDTLALGTSAPLERDEAVALPLDGTRIRLVEVVEDSRCPAGVDCIRAGEARVRFALTDADGSDRLIVLDIPGGLTGMPKDVAGLPRVEAGPYVFRLLRLQPYPGLAEDADVPLTATLHVEERAE